MRERLYRSRSDRMIFGVAGGMARWLDLDPSLVRIVWALLVLTAGVGLVLYVVAAIVIPEEPAGYQAAIPGADPAGARAGLMDPAGAGQTGGSRPRGNVTVVIGVALVALGAWFLLRPYIPAFDSELVWPALLVIVGLALLVGSIRGSRGRDST